MKKKLQYYYGLLYFEIVIAQQTCPCLYKMARRQDKEFGPTLVPRPYILVTTNLQPSDTLESWIQERPLGQKRGNCRGKIPAIRRPYCRILLRVEQREAVAACSRPYDREA